LNIMDRIAVSATGGDSKKLLDEVLQSYSSMGYRNFEVWLKGRGSAFDMARGAEFYLEKGKKYGMGFSSLHLLPVEEPGGGSLREAIDSALFAEQLGIETVVFNATTKEVYKEAAKKFLDALEGHSITAVIQVHEGRSIETMDDLTEVLDAVGDERLKVLHEVGTFHALGVSWRDVCERFNTRIGLVHVKDMIGDQSVPLGTGEVDIPGLFRCMRSIDYPGFFVIEIANRDRENTNRYFSEAVSFLKEECQS
jgi:sugar phosphate isomerase/epimerase